MQIKSLPIISGHVQHIKKNHFLNNNNKKKNLGDKISELKAPNVQLPLKNDQTVNYSISREMKTNSNFKSVFHTKDRKNEQLFNYQCR